MIPDPQPVEDEGPLDCGLPNLHVGNLDVEVGRGGAGGRSGARGGRGSGVLRGSGRWRPRNRRYGGSWGGPWWVDPWWTGVTLVEDDDDTVLIPVSRRALGRLLL